MSNVLHILHHTHTHTHVFMYIYIYIYIYIYVQLSSMFVRKLGQLEAPKNLKNTLRKTV